MSKDSILVVEDELKIAELIRDYLVQDGFSVCCLRRGDEVVDKVKKLGPALILLDLMLPGMDGISVCREIRKFSNIPIIMVTAKVEEIDRLIGLELGADDYICKPFSPREVVARTKAVLRRVNAETVPRRLEVGPIVIDEDIRQVTVCGVPITLTPSEFGLLHVLAGAPGRVFSRTELLGKIQGYHFEGYDRTIDSHVKNLRKKISEQHEGEDLIVTIYGVGYKFSV